MTTGTIMLYGGIAGAAVLAAILIVILATANRKRKQLIDKVQKEL